MPLKIKFTKPMFFSALLATERGVCCLTDLLISFLVSVMASVASYSVCKWLDRNDSDN